MADDLIMPTIAGLEEEDIHQHPLEICREIGVAKTKV